jgi:DNA-binding beta-propeller fold protein YncE/mono/diheme cytochrome c family protein
MRLKLVLSIAVIAGCGADGGKTPPPFGVPISGGTILVTQAGDHVVISDPDRDRILTVDLRTSEVVGEIALTAGDEPGRLIEDGAGRIHVALRRGGSLLTLAGPTSSEIADRRFVCIEPRGIAWDAAANTVHVACTGGELVTFPAAGGNAVRRLRLDRDLRDVIVSGTQLVVTRFRTSEVLTLDAQGAIVSRVVPPPVFRFSGGVPTDGGPGEPGMGFPPEATAEVAYRTIQLPDGKLVMSHQRQVPRTLGSKEEGGYGGNCDSPPVESAVTVIHPGQPPLAIGPIARGALPVDIAASRTGDKLAVLLAGQKTVTIVDTSFAMGRPDEDRCGEKDDDDDDDDDDQGEDLGTPTSTAFTKNGDVLVFYPEKAALIVRVAANSTKRLIQLTGGRANDSGRAVFHTQTAIGLACASCHPEGRDDGQVWNFSQLGSRRTQSLAGNLLERAPFHWSGDMSSLEVLMDDVFSQRMSGGPVTPAQKSALAAWLDRIPAPSPGAVLDTAAVERGRVVFDSEETACRSCHNGDLLTNNLLVDVGTGGKFKVPSLIGIGDRAPFMHTGCADTLTARFGVCGGNSHGRTAHLTPAQIADMVAFLESL